MTVKELIKKLSEYDGDLQVTVDGYEGGHTSSLSFQRVELEKDANSEWWYGEHEKAEDRSNNVFSALNIGR